MKKLVMVALTIVLSACGSLTTQPPAVYSFEPVSTFDRSFDEVWQGLIYLASERAWPIELLETDSGFMSLGVVEVNESYIDCGEMRALFTGPEFPPTASANITVQETDGRTRVRVNLVNAVQIRGTDRVEFLCTSRGVFEQEVLDALSVN